MGQLPNKYLPRLKNLKIYVAGHTGLVGSAILRCLNSVGYRNILTSSSSDLNLMDQAAVDSFFAAEKPDIVYHCAARVGGIKANSAYPGEFIYQNLMMTANVVDAARKYGVKKLLNFGSACMYPRDASQSLNESCLLTGALEPTNEAYAIAKIAGLKLCHYYNCQYGTNFLTVAPTNQYGPGDNFNMDTGHVLPMLLRRFHIAKLLVECDFKNIRRDFKLALTPALDNRLREHGGPDKASVRELESVANALGAYADRVVVWGDGSARREFMFSEDLADACVYLMENYDAEDLGEFVNIGSGEDILMRDAIELARETVGFKGRVEYDKSKPNGMPQKLLDSTKIRSLGWRPRVELATGLKLAYESYLNSQLASDN